MMVVIMPSGNWGKEATVFAVNISILSVVEQQPANIAVC